MSTDVTAFLTLLHPAGDVFEIRSIKCPHRRGGDFVSTHSGYFLNAEVAAQRVALLELKEPPAIYVTANPVRPELMARAANVIIPKAPCTTADTDILQRVWLFIDIDPVRPAGVSSTDAEMQAALDLAGIIRVALAELGWPDGVLCMSGNGAYLLYRIDRANDPDATDLIARVLSGLQRYNTPAATVDTTAVNAARILKVIGTTARKGSHLVGVSGIEDRPHRQSWFEPPTGQLNVVSREQLEEIAVPVATTPKRETAQQSNHKPTSAFDVAGFIRKHNLDASEPRDWPGHGQRWTLNTSPLCSHGGDGPYIGTMASGAVVAGCHHNTCKGLWGWKELRAKVEELQEETGSDDDVISNGFAHYVPDKNTGLPKREIRPLKMQTLIDVVNVSTEEWPRHANGSLFVVQDNQARWLERTEDLFGYLHLVKPVRWHSGERFVTRAEFRSALISQATKYLAIENHPHEPLVKNHFYLSEQPPEGDGKTLSAFLDFFCPETLIDRDLLQAALMTMAWGGPGGKRPTFLITAKGRGSGKTTAAEQLASVFGGCMSFSLGDSAKEMKERLLSPEALVTRAAILDNIKTTKFSSSDIEALITAGTISGKRMYVGEASRPNTITWFVTVNGASLGKDMSQRCVPIRVKRPEYSRDWDAKILEFIEVNRQQIIGDVLAVLRSPGCELTRYSRWPMWESAVLEKLAEPNDIQKVILERQAALDTDAAEVGAVWEYFRARLDDLAYDVDDDIVFIPSRIAIRWLTEATSKPFNATSGPQYLNQQIDECEILNLTKSARHGASRGYRWIGDVADSTEPGRDDLDERIRKQDESKRANRSAWTNT